MLLASVCWSYGSLFGMIVAGCLAACAVFNTYVLCAYVQYYLVVELERCFVNIPDTISILSLSG